MRSRLDRERTAALRLVLLAAFATFAAAPRPAEGQVVINEVLAANRDSSVDEDGDSSDWIELFGAGPTAIDLTDFALTDDPFIPRKWVFPEIAVEAGERLLVWCSGKDRVQPLPEVIEQVGSPVRFTPLFVSLDDEWRVLTGAPEDGAPPLGWQGLEFDDSSWPSGLPGFGYDVGERTEGLRTEVPAGHTAVFLRRRFRVDDPDSVPNLVLQVDYDDGFVAYLNGERVAARLARDEEEPTFASKASRSHPANGPENVDLTERRGLMRPGDNVLALVALNSSTSSRDLVLFPELGTVSPILHTNFRIDRTSEFVVLSDPSGALVDLVALGPQAEDRSFGRYPDGGADLLYMLFPTPGEANDHHVSAEPLSSGLRLEPEGGVYDGPIELSVSARIPFEGFQIRFTSSGTPPTPESAVWTGPLNINRDLVIRAAGFLDGERVTPIATHSYFRGALPRRLTLPIISVGMDPTDFRTVHLMGDARGRTSERPGHIEFFDDAGQRQAGTGFGLRVHGGAGRSGGMEIKKAYRAYFRGTYGDRKLHHRAIPDTEVDVFDKLVLRSNFNDAFRTGPLAASHIRDQLIRDLHEDMGAVVSHGAWYNLFVNGQYLGLYNVVERMDRVFLASYFPEIGEDWDVIKTGNDVLDGDGLAWNELLRFMGANDLQNDDLYEEALRMVDIENFTGYMLLNIWAQNHDWPHNNWYAARPRRPDGRWIFLSWDAEFGIGRIPPGYNADTFSHVFSRNSSLTTIFSGLMRSVRYQRHLLEELERHLESALAPENVLGHIDRLRRLVIGDMDEEITLHGGGTSVSNWLGTLRGMEIFARERNRFVRNFIVGSPRLRFTRITGVTPGRIVPEDEASIAIHGLFFTPQTLVRFEAGEGTSRLALSSPSVEYVNGRELRAAVPLDIRLEGAVSVTVEDEVYGTFTAADALKVTYLRPEVTAITPAAGAQDGGDVVRVLGDGFTAGVRVEFGGVPSPSVIRLDRETIEAVTPPGSGTVPVLVVNTMPAELPAAAVVEFTYERRDAFIRGDADGDGSVNISDVVGVLRYLFARPGGLPCRDALDADDSGRVNVTDALFLLDFMYRSGPAPPAPRQSCAADPTPDALGCDGPTACR